MLQILLAIAIDTCFVNPGTSEMHSGAALDRVREMRHPVSI